MGSIEWPSVMQQAIAGEVTQRNPVRPSHLTGHQPPMIFQEAVWASMQSTQCPRPSMFACTSALVCLLASDLRDTNQDHLEAERSSEM